MGKRRRVSGYRSQRSGSGCVSLVIWAGIFANLGLILYTLNNGQGFSFGALRLAMDNNAAINAFNRGDLSEAIMAAQGALRVNPTDTAAAMTLTRALVYRSYADFQYEPDLAAALAAGAAIAAAYPDDPHALAAHAFALQANGQPVEAVAVAEQALDLEPEHTLARTALALGYARVGSFDRAQRESERAVMNGANTPEHFDARRALAISTADLGRYEEAGSLLDDLIQDYRGVIPLYYERALYARQISDAETAERAYYAVLRLDETNVKARLRLCEFANSIGERDTAITHCQQVTQDAPLLATGWYQLGRLHFLNGEFELAQQTLNRCSTLQVTQGTPPGGRIFECWYLQGQAAEILGNCDALLTTYNQFRLMATDPQVRETWTYPPEGPPMCQ